jgi:hypothetical protein
MVDILHKVGIKASSQDDAYKALSTIKGLSGWWTTNTQGESKVGGVIQFRFGAGGFDMKVCGRRTGRMDRHENQFRPPTGGRLDHHLLQTSGWKEPVEFMHHCSTKWGVFLLSLKSVLETGKGAPWPNEIKLDSWE